MGVCARTIPECLFCITPRCAHGRQPSYATLFVTASHRTCRWRLRSHAAPADDPAYPRRYAPWSLCDIWPIVSSACARLRRGLDGAAVEDDGVWLRFAPSELAQQAAQIFDHDLEDSGPQQVFPLQSILSAQRQIRRYKNHSSLLTSLG